MLCGGWPSSTPARSSSVYLGLPHTAKRWFLGRRGSSGWLGVLPISCLPQRQNRSPVQQVDTEFIGRRSPGEFVKKGQRTLAAVAWTANVSDRSNAPMSDRISDAAHRRSTQLKYGRKGYMAEDQQLICSDCGQSFTFTAEDQEFFRERGYSAPKRCKTCRQAKKNEQSGGGGGGYHRSAPQSTSVICSGWDSRPPFHSSPEAIAPCIARIAFRAGRTAVVTAAGEALAGAGRTALDRESRRLAFSRGSGFPLSPASWPARSSHHLARLLPQVATAQASRNSHRKQLARP